MVWVWVLVAVQSLLAKAPVTGTATEHPISCPLKYSPLWFRTTDFDFYGIVLMLTSWFTPSSWLSSEFLTCFNPTRCITKNDWYYMQRILS